MMGSQSNTLQELQKKLMNEYNAYKEGKISEKDLDIFHLVDSAEEAVDVIEDFYQKYSIKPNF